MEFQLVQEIEELREESGSRLSFSKEPYFEVGVPSGKDSFLSSWLSVFLKRSFDVIFSSLVIVFILSWFIPILALLIKLDSKGPVFFIQMRNGKDGKLFPCIKLRTMVLNIESNYKQSSAGDERITRLGGFLRVTNLDELPQFLNVFMGHMSVVGPRPHMESHTRYYSGKIGNYMSRHVCKPGVTGLAQVRGNHGPTPRTIDMAHRVKYDVFYIRKYNFFIDFYIIYKTIHDTFYNRIYK